MEDVQAIVKDMSKCENTLQLATHHVDRLIEMTTTACKVITENPSSAKQVFSEFDRSIQETSQKLYNNIPKKTHALKGMHSTLAAYDKLLKVKFKNRGLPEKSAELLLPKTRLITRAVAIHLLREGNFDIVSLLKEEVRTVPVEGVSNANFDLLALPDPNENDLYASCQISDELIRIRRQVGSGQSVLPPSQPQPTESTAPVQPVESDEGFKEENVGKNPCALELEFATLHRILHSLRVDRDLGPAMEWARSKSEILGMQGSDLEFELCRLEYIRLFLEGDLSHSGDGASELDHDHDRMDVDSQRGEAGSPAGIPIKAWMFARTEMVDPIFASRYPQEIMKMMAAMAYWENITQSPYRHVFNIDCVWEDMANLFTREFCSLMELPGESPLYVAVTAGAIAVPVLLKLQRVMKEGKAEWTSAEELPVEIPLPPSFHYHPIFVCPVSKEQANDSNPPMMLPCCHVIARESLERISKGTLFKCPYCPGESHPQETCKVYL